MTRILATGAQGLALLAVLSVLGEGQAFGQVTYENNHVVCQDQMDNDRDGYVDCNDQDCIGLAVCAGGQVAVAAENTAQACQDRVDNDHDGYADCADQDCSALVFCATPSTVVVLPAAGGQVVANPTGAAPSPGWARGAAITGWTLLPLVLVLGTASEVTNHTVDELVPTLPLGVATALIFAVVTPLVAAGARSANRHPAVSGCVGCRIGGWVTYGLAAIDAAVLIGFGVADEEVPPGIIASVTLLACVSMVLMTYDAMASRRQASALSGSASTRANPSRLGLVPFVAPLATGRGLDGGVVGLAWAH